MAAELEVAGVLNLAFPLHPPGQPEKSRAPELLLPVNAAIPTLVVQGLKDPLAPPPRSKQSMIRYAS
ncbi:alpha/beta family hydrolase [Ornithinimicrobium sp. INDO-MA30-4]|uniref:alpha/beta family hydrolase n=1 Tax=Ornithinimicrobium sp. INDO-MA30-4 TaxID=2908651 RepID=UPI0037C723E2